MYYFFISKDRLEDFKLEFEKTRKSMDEGKTPVFSETRCARTNLIEAIPHYLLQGAFVVVGALILQRVDIGETLKLAAVLLVNGVCSTISNSIFVFVKSFFRKRMLQRLGLEVNERNISVLESLEYQSV